MKARLAKKLLKRAVVLELRHGDMLLVKGLTDRELESAHGIFAERGIQLVGVPEGMRVQIVAPLQVRP